MNPNNESPRPRNLAQRVAIVTGAGSGIGRSMATHLAAAGATVVVHDIVAERVKETVSLIERAGGAAVPAVADVCDEQAVDAMVKRVAEQFRRLDILCNNAGVMDDMADAANTSTQSWNRVISVNLTGCFLMARAVLPHMLARKSGSIINTASEAALRGSAAGLAYVASKHGVVGLTKSIAWAYRHEGIRCNAICPGGVETGIIGGKGFETFNPAYVARLLPALQLASPPVQPDKMATVAVFLASDDSSFINGAVIPVDGGWSAG